MTDTSSPPVGANFERHVKYELLFGFLGGEPSVFFVVVGAFSVCDVSCDGDAGDLSLAVQKGCGLRCVLWW